MPDRRKGEQESVVLADKWLVIECSRHFCIRVVQFSSKVAHR